ncbi:ferritin-like domain-containing protein [Jiangella mangrovi]|uniref:DUF4439 domain-containing protein n=1 Tax=Jiangella mangrovi TaxID=1524084 RepID=A0A7W9GUG3_9ACTN|nr:ferritin-like domain-containing protein [Jiangella mangrovi]MBB5789891.1 hypothetical protein [Jiangella mangrovi]
MSLDATQAALAGEHACVYGYGVVGAHLPDGGPAALSALAAHRERRDALTALIRAAGEDPVAAEPGYALPSPVTDEASARALAVLLEERLGGLYADLVGAADSPELRELAARGVVSVAVQALAWGGAPAAFPGLDGRV